MLTGVIRRYTGKGTGLLCCCCWLLIQHSRASRQKKVRRIFNVKLITDNKRKYARTNEPTNEQIMTAKRSGCQAMPFRAVTQVQVK